MPWYEVKVPFQAAYSYRIAADSPEDALEVVGMGQHDNEEIIDVEIDADNNNWSVDEVEPPQDFFDIIEDETPQEKSDER